MNIDKSLLPPIESGYNLPEKLTRDRTEAIRIQILADATKLFEDAYDEDTLYLETRWVNVRPDLHHLNVLQPRKHLWVDQLTVADRYLEDQITLDKFLTGGLQEEYGGSPLGIPLPVDTILKPQRKDGFKFTTSNFWSVEAYEHYRDQLEGQSDDASQESSFQKKSAQKEHVLTEDDRVFIYDARGECVGTGTVTFATGNIVEIVPQLDRGETIELGFSVIKQSTAGLSVRYKNYVIDALRKLDVDYIHSRHGCSKDIDHSGVRSLPAATNLTLPEQAFFGVDMRYVISDAREQKYHRSVGFKDIPRTLIDDESQSIAFALGAMGLPCFMVQGPPGTGKTTVIANLLSFYQQCGHKTLLLSHSNVAVDVALLGARKKGKVHVHRAGANIETCDPQLHDSFLHKKLKRPQRSDFMRKYSGSVFGQSRIGDEKYQEALQKYLDDRAKMIHELQQEKGLVVGCTLSSLVTDGIVGQLEFDNVIVDEASRALLHEILPALVKAKKQIIFVGDHKQLGNIDFPNYTKEILPDVSTEPYGSLRPITQVQADLFAGGMFKTAMYRSTLPAMQLKTNRRALPYLADLVSQVAYEGTLKAGRVDIKNTANGGEILLYDYGNRPDAYEQDLGKSKVNITEAHLIARKLRSDDRKGLLTATNFAVITMYNEQRQKILDVLARTEFRSPEEKRGLLNLVLPNILTVDSAQGSERERIYLALTRSNLRGEVGFLVSPERANVALSRAQDSLTVFGDFKTLVELNADVISREFYAKLHELAQRNGKIISEFLHVSSRGSVGSSGKSTHNARRKSYKK